MADARALLEPILALHDRIRASVVDACSRHAAEPLATVDAWEASATLSRTGRRREAILIEGPVAGPRPETLCRLAAGPHRRGGGQRAS